jgi:Flp pilus assembly secretin CpaC
MAYRILTAAALAVALATPAFADDVIRPNGPPLAIKAGSGVLIQTAAPIRNVFVADTAIADVHVPTQGDRNLVYVSGKKSGKTSFYVLGDDGQVVSSHAVDVAGPRTVRVLRGQKEQIWSEVHGEPTNSGGNLADLPPGSAITVPVGQAR